MIRKKTENLIMIMKVSVTEIVNARRTIENAIKTEMTNTEIVIVAGTEKEIVIETGIETVIETETVEDIVLALMRTV